MKSKSIFCYAPWVHSHYTMTGKRALCCVATPFEESSSDKLKHWNSSQMKSARLAMLKGRPPEKHCQICIENVNNSFLPTQMFEGYSSLREEFISQTQEDGTYNVPARDYDFRMENTCNLSCRMCNPHASSKIEDYWKKVLKPEEPRLQSLVLKKNSLVNDIGPEFEKAIDQGEVEKIYWASGEAFFQASHWSLIDRIRQRGNSSRTILKYNTNLNYSYKTLLGILGKLEGFKEVILIVSIDGVGPAGEFIRDGLKWNTFLRALEEIEKTDHISIERFNVTMTITGLLEIDSLLKFLSQKQVELNISFCELGDQSSLLSPLSLDRDLLDELVGKAIDELVKYRQSHVYESFCVVLNNLLKIDLKEYLNNSQILYSFYESTQLDKAAKRESLLAHYQEYDLTNRWLKKIFNQFLKESVSANHHEPFWEKQNLSEDGQVDFFFSYNAHSFFQSLSLVLEFTPLLDRDELTVSYIGSYPSAISISTSAEDDRLKYEPFYFITQNSQLKLIKFIKIGYFSYLLRKKASLKKQAELLDQIILFFFSDFFMHYRAVFKINKKSLDTI